MIASLIFFVGVYVATLMLPPKQGTTMKKPTTQEQAVQHTESVLQEIAQEREKQRSMWGNSTDDTRCPHDWVAIIVQELHPMCWTDEESMREAAIKVAAVAVAAAEAADRQV